LEERLLLSAGDLDVSFGQGGFVATPGTGEALAAARQPDGKIVVAGTPDPNDAHASFVLSRYNPDGSLDAGFGDHGIALSQIDGGALLGVAVQADGKIVAVGTTNLFVDPPSLSDGVVIGFNADGSLDTGFGNGGARISFRGYRTYAYASAIALQPDGKIVVDGGDSPYTDTAVINLGRLNPDGSNDNSFYFSATPGTADGLAVGPDGKIYVNAGSLLRVNANGSLDAGFGTNGKVALPHYLPPHRVAPQPDGRVLVAGTAPDPSLAFLTARTYVNGTLDVTFNGSGVAQVFGGNQMSVPASILVQPDGLILVIGTNKTPTTGTPTATSLALARYNPNGSLDTSFGANGLVTTSQNDLSAAAALLQPDGKIVVVGTKTSGVQESFVLTRFLGDTPSGTPNQRFVSQEYLDLLQRPAEAEGLAAWSGLLDSGQASRSQVVQEIERSPEYHRNVI
jgi:uncharacterized delta-60 repeat protein